MKQATSLKKKVSNPNKAQSPLKNMNSISQYRSSAELVKEYEIKREQLSKEHNDKIRKSQSPMTHKRKNLEESVAQQGNILPTEDLDEHNKRLDDPVEQEEIGVDGWLNSDDDMNVDCGTNGEAVGPTDKAVSNLRNFIGTVGRTPRFINLLYTSWHAVPDETKKRMWDYVNSKFLIPKEGQKWVMHGLRDAWRGFKREVKRRCSDKRLTVEEMLEKRPAGVPSVHLRQLIEYWKLSEVECRTKENNEEPLKVEIFVATRTKTGKEVQADTQIAISKLENHQNAGKTPDDAFTAVFGKEKPGRVRGYGRSVTRTSLQKDDEINELKQKHANEVTSMKEEIISEMRQEIRQFFSQLVQNNPGLNFQDILGSDGSNIPSPDASNAQAIRGKNLSNSSGLCFG
ncbi:putative serine/threonine-protein kinase/receptor-like [Capsicum annuum]|nr:putative serine/threonine-protein kinase/receptor-like [Capsicum annuum]